MLYTQIHTRSAALHPNTGSFYECQLSFRISTAKQGSTGIPLAHSSKQTHTHPHHILVAAFQTSLLFFRRFLLSQPQTCSLPKYLNSGANVAHLSILRSALPIEAGNNACQYVSVYLIYKIIMEVTSRITTIMINNKLEENQHRQTQQHRNPTLNAVHEDCQCNAEQIGIFFST